MGAHQISISSLSLERGLKTSGREISSKNICGNTHIDSWTVHASSINLSSHHLSIFHTLFQTPTIHSSSIHHPSNQTSIHPSPTISSLSIIMHSPPNHYPSVYLFYTHLSSIYLSSTYPFIQPAIIILSIYLSFIHYSSVHHSAAINSHLPYLMHSLGPHPSILPASIHLFISHLSIHYSICHLSIHHFSCTKYPSNLYFSFISSYLSFISQTSTHQFIFHLFLFHPLSIFYSFFH